MRDLLDDLITTAEVARLLHFEGTKHPLKNVSHYLLTHDVPVYRRGHRVLVSRHALLSEMAEASTRRNKVRQQRARAKTEVA
jgi:hypothetical protein